MFSKDKSKAKAIKSTLSLKTRIAEIIDAIKYEDVFKGKEIKRITIEIEGEEE